MNHAFTPFSLKCVTFLIKHSNHNFFCHYFNTEGNSEQSGVSRTTYVDKQPESTTKPAVDSIFERTTREPEASQSRKRRADSHPKENRRVKRNLRVGQLNKAELKTIKTMEGFYVQPTFEQQLENMTWFNNYGKQCVKQTMLLNIMGTLHQMDVEELRLYGHSIDEMLQECTFMGQVCGPQDFTQFYSLKYGNCFTFNHGMDGVVSKVASPGKSSGLTMVLFINQDQYTAVMSPNAGVRMMLHRQGQVPLIEEDGFDFEPGTDSGVAVKYVEILRYGWPYSNCTNNMTLYRNNDDTYYPGNYTQKLCIRTCLQDAVIERCGCANPLYRKPQDVLTCNNYEQHICVEDAEVEVLAEDVCVHKCPLPCWESQYFHSISSSQWPSNRFTEYYAESLLARPKFRRMLMDDAEEKLRDNFVKLTVYYDNLNYYRYTERPVMTVGDLIGAVGGHLGLWIGMSIISFLELFEVIIHAVSLLVGKCKRM